MVLRILGVRASDQAPAPTTPETGSGQTYSYRHVQPTPSSVWRFTHDLPFHPAAIRIVDWDRPGDEWDAQDTYDLATRTWTLTFPVPVRGEAFLS